MQGKSRLITKNTINDGRISGQLIRSSEGIGRPYQHTRHARSTRDGDIRTDLIIPPSRRTDKHDRGGSSEGAKAYWSPETDQWSSNSIHPAILVDEKLEVYGNWAIGATSVSSHCLPGASLFVEYRIVTFDKANRLGLLLDAQFVPFGTNQGAGAHD
ncbi:hypothetical protein N7463_004730 [Penicillium fimorum]|uniref:Uncharacterized protein n=1 Tax=Penicillium fimorum TaxID=1882269 RepID=A0A9W9XSE6_9EURO|nr:hypothetical protein N7463_004730 [Penicillium fimorum]